MSFEVVMRTGQIFDLAARSEAIQFMERSRSFAITHGRAVEGPNWGIFGDGLEQPSLIRLRLYLDKELRERWQQRMTIEAIEASISTATVLRNLADLREYLIGGGHVTQESPTDDSYVLELTFWPRLARAGFLNDFPLGMFKVTSYGTGTAQIEPLDGVTTQRGTYTLEGADGATFTFETIEGTYG